MGQDSEHVPLLGQSENDVPWTDEFLALSVMASQVSLATFCRIALTSIDAAFLGHLGTKELAAASLAQEWTSVPLVSVWAGASALITLCGQAWGAGNFVLTGVWLQFGLIITTLCSIFVFIWFWNVRWVMALSTDDQAIVEFGVIFSKYLSFSIVPSLLYACLRQYFQAMGIMWATSVVGILSIGVAVACNYFFIYGAGTWAGLGFVGSPLATVVASWFQPITLILICVCWKGYHKRAWGGWDIKALTLRRMIVFGRVAGPIACSSFVTNLATSLICLIAARISSDVIAANAMLWGLWGMLWALFWGFGCATQVRVANYMGAGRPHNAKIVAFLGFGCTLACVLVLGAAVACFDTEFYRIYTNDPAILSLCRGVTWLFVLAQILQAQEILLGAVLNGMAKVTLIFWVTLTTMWLVELPLCWLLGLHLGYGLAGMWTATLIMEAIKATAYVLQLSYTSWPAESTKAMKAMEVTPLLGDKDEAANEEVHTPHPSSDYMAIRGRSSSMMASSLDHSEPRSHSDRLLAEPSPYRLASSLT